MPTLAHLLLAAVLLVPAVAQAAPPLRVGFGLSNQVFPDRAYDLVDTDDHLVMARLGAGWGFDVPFGRLDAELAAATGGTDAQVHAGTQAGLWLRGVEAGAAWRLVRFRAAEPYARLGLGWDWATLSLDETRLVQRDSSLALSGLAGVEIPIFRRKDESLSRGLVVDLGLGYTYRPSFRFSKLKPPESDEQAITRVGLPFGSLSLSGVVYRIGVALHL